MLSKSHIGSGNLVPRLRIEATYTLYALIRNLQVTSVDGSDESGGPGSAVLRFAGEPWNPVAAYADVRGWY